MKEQVKDLFDTYKKRYKRLEAEFEMHKSTMDEIEVSQYKARLNSYMYFMFDLDTVLKSPGVAGNP